MYREVSKVWNWMKKPLYLIIGELEDAPLLENIGPICDLWSYTA